MAIEHAAGGRQGALRHLWASSNGFNVDIAKDEVVSHPDVIAVGRSTNRDQEDNSARGPKLEYLAPGVDVYGATSGNSYRHWTGTSFAAPCAAGVAALALAVRPALTRIELRQLMVAACDKIGALPYVSGRNDDYGYGRVNASRAVTLAAGQGLEVAQGQGNGAARIRPGDGGGDGDIYRHEVVTRWMSCETSSSTTRSISAAVPSPAQRAASAPRSRQRARSRPAVCARGRPVRVTRRQNASAGARATGEPREPAASRYAQPCRATSRNSSDNFCLGGQIMAYMNVAEIETAMTLAGAYLILQRTTAPPLARRTQDQRAAARHALPRPRCSSAGCSARPCRRICWSLIDLLEAQMRGTGLPTAAAISRPPTSPGCSTTWRSTCYRAPTPTAGISCRPAIRCGARTAIGRTAAAAPAAALISPQPPFLWTMQSSSRQIPCRHIRRPVRPPGLSRRRTRFGARDAQRDQAARRAFRDPLDDRHPQPCAGGLPRVGKR